MNKINFKDKKFKEKGTALFEIFLLIISIAAFAYFIGNEFGFVSAGNEAEIAAAAKAGAVAEVPDVSLAAPAAPAAAPNPSQVLAGKEISLAPPTPPAPAPAPAPTPTLAEPTVPPAAGPSFERFIGNLGANWLGILANAAIAATLYLGVRAIFEWSGWCPTCDPELSQAWATALAAGYGGGAFIYYIANAIWGTATGWTAFGGAALTGGIGLVIAFFIMLIAYRESYVVAVQYNCYPWKPNTGGADCDACNGRDFPCTKYKCQSLGQSCELLNVGKKTQVCAWKDRNDPAPPKIEPWDEALTPGFKYNPTTTQTGDKGVEIINKTGDGCLPPFTRLDYGIKLDKLGQCRIDFIRKNSFNEMTNPGVISHEDWLKEHSLFSLHGGIDEANAEGLIKLPNGGNVEIFVRCLSRNGASNTETFVFKYCVSNEPDRSPPSVKLTDLPNGAPIQFGQTSREVKVYVDKPSDCKWSHNDEDYNTMPESQKMACSQIIGANTYFKCITNLTGLKDGIENKFYFKCKSYPANAEADRYENDQYIYRLIGTRLLVIDSITLNNGLPSGATIKDSTTSVKVTLNVKTSAGYNDGVAKCWYKKKTEADNRYNLFANTNSYQSSQDLWFDEGSYAYTIRCRDFPGNPATKDIDFSVNTDFYAPIVVRTYNEGNSLKIVTNEKAECVYSTTETTKCSYDFDSGLKMTTTDNLNQFTEWNTGSNFYIKCKDEFNNQPSFDGCSIIVRPFNSL